MTSPSPTPTVAAVIALGPNSVSATCLLFLDRDSAVTHLLALGLERDATDADLFRFATTEQEIALDGCSDSEEEWRENYGDEPISRDKSGQYVSALRAALFTGYYGGCGGVDAFEVREVPVGQPFHDWDLD